MLNKKYKKQAFENLKTMSAEQMEKILIAIGSVKVEKQESENNGDDNNCQRR